MRQGQKERKHLHLEFIFFQVIFQSRGQRQSPDGAGALVNCESAEMLQGRGGCIERFGQVEVNSAVAGGFRARTLVLAHLHVVVDQMDHTVKLLQLGLDAYDRVQSELAILVFDSQVSWSS